MISCFAKSNAKVCLSSLILFCLLLSFDGFSQGHESRIEITAFPNPTKGVFTIKSEIPLKDLETLLVTDLNGRVIHGFTMETSQHSLEFDFRNHPAGEYLIHLLFKNSTERVRIEKID